MVVQEDTEDCRCSVRPENWSGNCVNIHDEHVAPRVSVLLPRIKARLRLLRRCFISFQLSNLASQQNQCRQEFGHNYRLCYSQDPREICHALWCSDRRHGAECRTKKGKGRLKQKRCYWLPNRTMSTALATNCTPAMIFLPFLTQDSLFSSKSDRYCLILLLSLLISFSCS